MSTSDKAYRYVIPLDKSGVADSALYSVPSGSNVIHKRYRSTELVVVMTEPSPHFHKDSINVSVEEVDAEEYR